MGSPPDSGTLFRGDTITVVVSKGPDLVQVPDVRGKQESEAKAILESAGFKVEVDRVMGGFFGTARGTNPDGSERHNDLHVTLEERRAARRKAEAAE